MSSPAFTSVDLWTYRDTGRPSLPHPPDGESLESPAMPVTPGVPEEIVIRRIQEALGEAKQQWEAVAIEQQEKRNQKLAAALREFATKRSLYFRQVEKEIVHLTLAIARRILRREASIDPTLLVGLVRIALDDIGAEGDVCVHLSPADVSAWEHSQAVAILPVSLKLIEDPCLEPGDAVVETPVGRASISFEAQLKQVEQGFLDLLAHRPEQT